VRHLPRGAAIALLLSLLLSAPAAQAAELRVAAAANFRYALDEILADFHAVPDSANVVVTYGSSGTFYAQLQNGAPFDLFFSADMEYPRKLADAGLALGGDVFFYAAGRLVLWTPASSALDVAQLGMQALLAPAVKRIALANPRHAPYGVSAVAAMKALGVYALAEPKLVFGENIAQAAQFVQSGAADVGIIALSLALAPAMKGGGRYWEIPVDAYPRVDQGGIILGRTRDASSARRLRDFVLGDAGRKVLARYGYALPEN
jgi:molybdate transport system substrate-binding protein